MSLTSKSITAGLGALAVAVVVAIVTVPFVRHGVWQELDKLNPEAILIVFSLLGSALVGARVSVLWNLRQKRKELDLSTAHDFHGIYGEFFAVWKMWRYADRGGKQPGGSDSGFDRSELLERACGVEGRLESIIVRLACERHLSADDVRRLGEFRQLFQQLREAITRDEDLDWTYSEHPDYLQFKRLAVCVASLIVDDPRQPRPEAAVESLLVITSNRWERHAYGDFRKD